MRQLSLRSAELGAGDAEPRYEPLAHSAAAAFLAGEQNHVLVARDGDRLVGMLLAYELDRRHGDLRMLFVYEVGVHEDYRRRGIGRELLRRTRELARVHGIHEAFVLTEQSNDAAKALYAAAGGVTPAEETVMFDFDFAAEEG